jgi:predicted dehydrogenase
VIGVAGLGYWGPNLARNFAELGALTWLCDLDEQLRGAFATRYPGVQVTDAFEKMLADPAVQGVVVATPVPTHYELAKRALEAGKHVLVEKPPAMRAAEIDELVATAAARDLVLMPGHLLLYHSARCSACTGTGRTSASCGRTRTPSGRSASTTCP